MTSEFDPITEAESIIKSEEDRNFTIKIWGLDVVQLSLHLNTMKEIRRREIKVESVQEKDEDILSALESRFHKIVFGEPAEWVEMDISRREMDALGESLPKIRPMVKYVRKYLPHTATKFDSGFYGMVLDSYKSVNDTFVSVGGKDNPDLITRLERRR